MEYLQNYLETESTIETLNAKLKQLKEVQKKREPKILNIINDNNYELNGYIIKSKEQNSKESISLKYLEKILSGYLNTSEEDIKLINYINEHREVKKRKILDISKKK